MGFARSLMTGMFVVGAIGSVSTAMANAATSAGSLSMQPKAVGCGAPGACVVVGAGSQMETAVYSNGNWRYAMKAPGESLLAAGAANTASNYAIASMTCGSANFCVASGSVDPGVAITQEPFVSTWNGTTWTDLGGSTMPMTDALISISCPTSTFCAALSADGTFWTWSGKKWTNVAYPAANAIVASGEVSCISPTSCFAIGYPPLSSGTCEIPNLFADAIAALFGPLLNPVLSGSGWFPSLSGPYYTVVACSPFSSQPTVNAQIERWNGSTLTAIGLGESTSNIAPGTVQLSCGAKGFCYLLGPQPKIWNGATWSSAQLPPGNASGYTSDSLACSAAKVCHGWSNPTSGAAQAFTGDGNTWTTQSLPAGAGSAPASGLACSGPSFCMAISNSSGSSAAWVTTGSSWSQA